MYQWNKKNCFQITAQKVENLCFKKYVTFSRNVYYQYYRSNAKPVLQ